MNYQFLPIHTSHFMQFLTVKFATGGVNQEPSKVTPAKHWWEDQAPGLHRCSIRGQSEQQMPPWKLGPMSPMSTRRNLEELLLYKDMKLIETVTQ